MKSNVAFEVLDEVEVNSAGSSVIVGFDVVNAINNEVTSALAALEIDDDLPLSVSPMMNRKIDVKSILNAVNKTLPQD